MTVAAERLTALEVDRTWVYWVCMRGVCRVWLAAVLYVVSLSTHHPFDEPKRLHEDDQLLRLKIAALIRKLQERRMDASLLGSVIGKQLR